MSTVVLDRRIAVMAASIAATCVIAALPFKSAAIVAWVASGAAVLAWWVARVADPADRDMLVFWFIVGVLLRAMAAWLFDGYAHVNTDRRVYWYLGSRLEYMLVGPRSQDVDLVKALGTATGVFYYFWVAAHVYMLHSEAFVVASNVLVGATAGVLTYMIGREVWGRNAGVIGAVLVWLSGTHIQVDAQNLRDGMALVSVLAMLYGVQRISERWSVSGVMWFVLGSGVLLQVRSYIAFLLILLSVVAVVVMRREGRLSVVLVTASLAAVLGVVIAQTQVSVLIDKFGKGVSMVDLLVWAHVGLTARVQDTSTVSGVRLTSLQDMIMYAPIGLVRALIAPLPWNVSQIHYFNLPEVITRYFGLPLIVVGFMEALKRDWRRSFLLMLSLAAMALLYAVLELGGNVRHHAQFFPILYLLAGVGWSVARHYALEVALSAAALSLAIWGFGFSNTMFASRYFAALFVALGIVTFVALKLADRNRLSEAERQTPTPEPEHVGRA